MSHNELVRIRKEYYNNEIVQYEIVKCLKNRELAIITSKEADKKLHIRYLKAFTTTFFKGAMERFRIAENPHQNLYYSLSSLSQFPTFLYNMQLRKTTQEYIDFNNDYEKYIIAYDILFDLDNTNFEKAYADTKELKLLLDNNKIAYNILMSGRKGFHIRIPYEFTHFEKFDVSYKDKIAMFIYLLKEIHSIESIDTSIIDLKRIAKLPYSLVGDRIILPLSDKEFDNFKIEDIQYGNVDIYSLKQRGLLTRNHNQTPQELKQNFKKFFEEYEFEDLSGVQ